MPTFEGSGEAISSRAWCGMNRIICWLLAWALCLSIFTDLLAQSPQVSLKVHQFLQTGDQAAHLPVYLWMRARPDFNAYTTDPLHRLKVVNQMTSDLKNLAAQSQMELLGWLGRQNGVKANTIKSTWLANLVFAEVNQEVLAQLIRRKDLYQIGYDAPLHFEAPITGPTVEGVPFGVEPGLKFVGATEMWRMGYTGEGRKALVFDTGIDPTHPAYQRSFLGNDVPNESVWSGSSRQLNDCNTHGTHVLGTVLGLDPIRSDTIGVAIGARWMAAPGIGCGRAYTFFNAVETFQWCLDPDKNPATNDLPDAINNSWGHLTYELDECDNPYVDVLVALEKADVAVIFAAGNEGPNEQTLRVPALMAMDELNVFSVGALNDVAAFTIAEFSSRGPTLCGDNPAQHTKPEVAAPGVNVRSCGLNNTYIYLSGTSMASPHVTGVYLLLKEAFPMASARLIKQSLYESAVDLGIGGEDNNYGRGAIRAVAAFNWLKAQGLNPAAPSSIQANLQIARLTLPAILCGGGVVPELTLKNAGVIPYDSVIVTYRFLNITQLPTGNQERITFHVPLIPGNVVAWKLPQVDAPVGEHYLEVEVQPYANGMVLDDRLSDNRIRYFFNGLDFEYVKVKPEPLPVCSGSAPALLHLNPKNQEVLSAYWNTTSITPIAKGSPLVFPFVLTNDTTIYLDAVRTWQVGPQALSSDTTFSTKIRQGMYFNVQEKIILRSLDIYPSVAGVYSVALLNGDGTTLISKNVLAKNSNPLTVQLDWVIQPGDNYFLETGSNRKLVSLKNYQPFPLTYGPNDIVTVTGNSDGGSSQAWYSFFNWVFEAYSPCGRIPYRFVLAKDATPLNTSIQGPQEVKPGIDNTWVASENNLMQYEWYVDGTLSSTSTDLTTRFQQEGNYHLALLTNNGTCTHATHLEVNARTILSATPPGGPILEATIVPNPSAGPAWWVMHNAPLEPGTLYIYNNSGQLTRSWNTAAASQHRIELPLDELPPGLYWARWLSAGGLTVSNRFAITR